MYRVNIDWKPPAIHPVYYEVDLPPGFLNPNDASNENVIFPKQILDENIFYCGDCNRVHTSPPMNYIEGSLDRKTGEMDVKMSFYPKTGATVSLKNVEVHVFYREDGGGKKFVHDKTPLTFKRSDGTYLYNAKIGVYKLDNVESIWRIRVVFNFAHEKNTSAKVAKVPMDAVYPFDDKDAVCSHFKDYFETKTYADFIPEAENGKQFPVHRAILARASEFFKATFDGNFKEKKEGLVKFPASASTLQSLLRWIYTKELEVSGNEVVKTLMDLYGAADYCRLVVLKGLLHSKILDKVNVTDLFRFAKGRQDGDGDDIAKAAFDIIKKEKQQIFMNEGLRAFKEEFPMEDLD